MEVRMDNAGGVLAMRPIGRLDGPGAAKFRQQAAGLYRDPPPLAVDLGEVAALLAVGAEALLWLVQRHRAANVPLAFARPRPAALRLLQACGLTALAPVYATLAEARTALAAAAKAEG